MRRANKTSRGHEKPAGTKLPRAETPAGLGYHGENGSSFWATMGRECPRHGRRAVLGVASLGYCGQNTRRFGLPWTETPAGLGCHGQNWSCVWETMGRERPRHGRRAVLGLASLGYRTNTEPSCYGRQLYSIGNNRPGRPPTENHSVAVNYGPGPGERPRSGEPADQAANAG